MSPQGVSYCNTHSFGYRHLGRSKINKNWYLFQACKKKRTRDRKSQLVWSFDFQGICITLQQTLRSCYIDVHISKFVLLICCSMTEGKGPHSFSISEQRNTLDTIENRSMLWCYMSTWLDFGGTTSSHTDKSAPLLPSPTPTPSCILGVPCQLSKWLKTLVWGWQHRNYIHAS